VLGPAAAAVGALQAAAAIRFLVQGPPAIGESPALIALNAWTGEFRSLPSTALAASDCPCCRQRNFPFLSTSGGDFTTTLCGRRAVQVLPAASSKPIDLGATAQRWQEIGTVARSPWFVRCKLNDPPGIELTLFPDGRLVVHGTTEPMRATSLYARFVGN
jgi:adenylyltransferase/sulfurtransferase